ncbi:MAG: hypothetical protein K9J37_13185 [Saprospiraceae bacterium]|nr:hypothetical protein [Saprospiraceae bacterium]MCF8250862.1 hypothetical protein [Saprospiraceae bacterium]MCF8280679.1 hypothetical protein [Bacteroidales bacterium]MCF8312737.1 hypothetical protein [Saprospiraceae bacterium]MCF8441184.1 hypothetical protein [Saprospiraceae bacterium]
MTGSRNTKIKVFIHLFSVLCPSFQTAGQIFDIQQVAFNLDRVMGLARHMAHHCKGRLAELARGPGEALRGKRVIMGEYGGRTRTREYDASAFWKKENVESLYFLRGIVLSFRWQIMMKSLVGN